MFAASWVKQFGNIQFLIVTIGAVVFFTLLLVTGNTMAISVRERFNELAVLKAIGFSDRWVLFFVLAESLTIALVGGLLGLALAMLAIPALGAALNGLLPTLFVNSQAILSRRSLRASGRIRPADNIFPRLDSYRWRILS